MHDSEPTSLDQRLQQLQQHAPLRVHDVLISGNTRTKDYIIERHLQSARAAQTVGELASALEDAKDGLERLNLFASVQVAGDSGPKELPDTANINVTVEELKDGPSFTFGKYVQVRFHLSCIPGRWKHLPAVKLRSILFSRFRRIHRTEGNGGDHWQVSESGTERFSRLGIQIWCFERLMKI